MCASFPLLDRLKKNEKKAVSSLFYRGFAYFLQINTALLQLPVGQTRFISVIFFFPRNLGGNRITQIQNGTFQAWHGMQFLQKLILSHNPLSVIADTSFFELPSVKYLDLGATQVTQQTLLMLLLTTVCLETLKLPSDMACCLCQEKLTTETPCRTIKFHCENLCTTSAPQCARTDAPAGMQGEIMEAVQSRKRNTSAVLNLKPKSPSLGDHDTVTLGVVLSLTGTDGDLSNPNDPISRTNSYSPQPLSRQEGKTSKELLLLLHSIQHMGWTSETDIRKLYFLAKALVAELKNKLHKAKNIMTVKNTISSLPTPAMQDEVHEIPAAEEETTAAWVQKQRDLGLNEAALNPWEAAGGLNPTDNISIFGHHKISAPLSKHSLSRSPAEAPRLSASLKIQNYSNAVEQTKKTHRMEDVEDVEDAEEAPSPRQDYVWTHTKHKQGDSLYKSNQLFYKMFGNVNPEEKPTPTESEAEWGLNKNQHFFYNLMVNDSPSAARSVLEDTAEEEGSSLGERLPAIPQTAETHWKQQKEGSSFLSKPGSSDSPDGSSLQGDLFETEAHRPLRSLIPDEAPQVFIAHMARALRMDCGLPELQLACAKMVWKTGLLVKLLSERQDDPGASALAGQCLPEGNVSSGMASAREAGRKTAGKWKAEYISSDRLLLAVSASVIIAINLMVICLIEVCSQKPAAASQPQSTSKSCPRRFFQKLLPQRWIKSKYDVRGQSSRVSDPSKTTPQWLRDLYQPLDSQHKKSMAQLYDEETSDEEIFNKSKLNWMPTAPQKSCDRGDMQLYRDPIPLPCSSGAPQELEQWSLSTEEDAVGSHMLGIPQTSSQRDGNRRATRDREPS
ncbi:leucine-rich repeat-containing protein 37B isoform X2 [Phalacrocorax carbo]|uniref:leucine-rich repeat-containing protein 37B isoform X2 n=1 Tax=Phalacrocorax carbo TaxID=9209 RepID=UPI00311A5592